MEHTFTIEEDLICMICPQRGLDVELGFMRNGTPVLARSTMNENVSQADIDSCRQWLDGQGYVVVERD